MIVRQRDLGDAFYRMPVVRFWDLAGTPDPATTPKGRAKAHDPDYTAGGLLGLHQGEWYLYEVRRTRASAKGVEDFMWRTHLLDDEWLERSVPIRVEKEGGSSGLIALDQLARNRFVGCDFKGRSPQGSKRERAVPMAVAAEAGRFHLIEGDWVETWLDEVELFPDAAHDDQVDCVTGAMRELRPRVGDVKVTPQAIVKQPGMSAWGAVTGV